MVLYYPADPVCYSMEFGALSTYLETEGWVYHMEIDLANDNELLFTDNSSIKTTNGNSWSNIVGSASVPGYSDGEGASARFSLIKGFCQMNATALLVADYGHFCLRLVDRGRKNSTSTFVGPCSINAVGTKLQYPWSIIMDGARNQLWVTQPESCKLQKVSITTREVQSFMAAVHIDCHTKGLTFDMNQQNLLITTDYNIIKFNLRSSEFTEFAGYNHTSGLSRFRDGHLTQATFDDATDLIYLSQSIILVADTGNDRLRVINEVQESVSSICYGEPRGAAGSVRYCGLNRPYCLMRNRDLIFIGQRNSIGTITCEYRT